MSEYLPDDSDPNYNKLLKNATHFRQKLENKYPISCDTCQKEVDNLLSKKKSFFKTFQLKEALKRSTPIKFKNHMAKYTSKNFLFLIFDQLFYFIFDTRLTRTWLYKDLTPNHSLSDLNIDIKPTFRVSKYFLIWLSRFFIVIAINVYTWNVYSKQFWGSDLNNLLGMSLFSNFLSKVLLFIKANFEKYFYTYSNFFAVLVLILKKLSFNRIILPLATLQMKKFNILWPLLALSPSNNLNGFANYRKCINGLFFWRLLVFNFRSAVNFFLKSKFHNLFSTIVIALDVFIIIAANSFLSISSTTSRNLLFEKASSCNFSYNKDSSENEYHEYHENQPSQSINESSLFIEKLQLDDVFLKNSQIKKSNSLSTLSSNKPFNYEIKNLKQSKLDSNDIKSAIHSHYIDSRDELNRKLGTNAHNYQESSQTAEILSELSLLDEFGTNKNNIYTKNNNLSSNNSFLYKNAISSNSNISKNFTNLASVNRLFPNSNNSTRLEFFKRNFFPKQGSTGLEDLFDSKLNIDSKNNISIFQLFRQFDFFDFFSISSDYFINLAKKMNIATTMTTLTSLMLMAHLIIITSSAEKTLQSNPPKPTHIKPLPKMTLKLKQLFGWSLLSASIISFILPTLILVSFYGKFGHSQIAVYSDLCIKNTKSIENRQELHNNHMAAPERICKSDVSLYTDSSHCLLEKDYKININNKNSQDKEFVQQTQNGSDDSSNLKMHLIDVYIGFTPKSVYKNWIITRAFKQYISLGQSEIKAHSIQYNVCVTTTPVVDELIFGLFCAGYSISQIQKHIHNTDMGLSQDPGLISHYLENQILLFKLFEDYLHKPDYFLDQVNIFAASTAVKLKLIDMYYSFDDNIIHELLVHSLSHRLKRKTGEIALKTGKNVSSIIRQYDNIKRILRFSETEDPLKLEKRLIEKFKISTKLAKYYINIIFICVNRLDLSKKLVSSYTFSDINYCAQVIIQCYTYLSNILDSDSPNLNKTALSKNESNLSSSTSIASSSSSISNDGIDEIFDKKIFLLARKILANIIDNKENFEIFSNHVLNNSINGQYLNSTLGTKKEPNRLNNFKVKLGIQQKISANTDKSTPDTVILQVKNSSSEPNKDCLNFDINNAGASTSSPENNPTSTSQQNDNIDPTAKSTEEKKITNNDKDDSNNFETIIKNSFFTTEELGNSVSQHESQMLATEKFQTQKYGNLTKSLSPFTILRTLVRNILLSVISLDNSKSRRNIFTHIIEKIVNTLISTGMTPEYFSCLVNRCISVIHTHFANFISITEQLNEPYSKVHLILGGIKLIALRLYKLNH
ncbi:hypothetical protein BB561_000595 [Smittium simulii]|uniref:Uncharacterized protein n=1 Tax=Smittium simulii TaxID=133385 RepID=A0A2T9YYK7_9FUNG|nr:hypothetical protein BB561_000595 [Smittium simulii]